MGHHYRFNTCIHEHFEGIELYAVQSLPVTSQIRQDFVRIRSCIAMSRKVFCATHDAGLLKAFHVGNSPLGYLKRFLTKGTISDYGIGRVSIAVSDGRKVEVNPHTRELTSYFVTCLTYQTRILNSSQTHIPRKARNRIQAHRQAPFCILGDEVRNTCAVLEGIGQAQLSGGASGRKDDSSQIFFFQQSNTLLELLPFHIRGQLDHKKLTKFLVQTHLIVLLIDPPNLSESV